MNPFATKPQRCTLAAALGTVLLVTATPGLANDQLADLSLDGSQASWIPKAENQSYELKLFVSPEGDQVCCDEPVGPDGVTVDLEKWGVGAYKYELTAVPPRQPNKAAAILGDVGAIVGDSAIDENGRPASAVQSRVRVPKAESRSAVQSGYFTYGVDPNAEE